MKQIEAFYAAVTNEMAVPLATAADGIVTMRLVSPVSYHGSILIFTGAGSKKYRQLKDNPNGCLSIGGFFVQVTAEFRGATMAESNEPLRSVYSEKFPGAFIDGVEFGGRNAEFILLHPTRLSGWMFENDTPTADGIPNVPFEIPM